mmetsp:Transcript_6419/g.18339  ORF Transcript_6419/g.18339 Transcript_6419/m.18339 type:complete len:126 (-) Transcript_6419:1302-1679(-)
MSDDSFPSRWVWMQHQPIHPQTIQRISSNNLDGCRRCRFNLNDLLYLGWQSEWNYPKNSGFLSPSPPLRLTTQPNPIQSNHPKSNMLSNQNPPNPPIQSSSGRRPRPVARRLPPAVGVPAAGSSR